MKELSLAARLLPIGLTAVAGLTLVGVRPSLAEELGLLFALILAIALLARTLGNHDSLVGLLAPGALFAWSLSQPSAPSAGIPLVPVLLASAIGFALTLLVISYRHQMPKNATWIWIVLVTAFGWIVVFYSSPRGAPGGSAFWLADWLGISPATAEILVIAVRKIVHFTFYGVFAWVGWRLARAAESPWRSSWGFAIGIALAHAAFDEARQGTFQGRTGSAWDVLLDLAGAVVFVGLAARAEIRPKTRLGT